MDLAQPVDDWVRAKKAYDEAVITESTTAAAIGIATAKHSQAVANLARAKAALADAQAALISVTSS